MGNNQSPCLYQSPPLTPSEAIADMIRNKEPVKLVVTWADGTHVEYVLEGLG